MRFSQWAEKSDLLKCKHCIDTGGLYNSRQTENFPDVSYITPFEAGRKVNAAIKCMLLYLAMIFCFGAIIAIEISTSMIENTIMEGDLTCGGEHAIQYPDNVL